MRYSLAGKSRGIVWYDKLHTRYNRFKTAAGDAGLKELWSEGSVLTLSARDRGWEQRVSAA